MKKRKININNKRSKKLYSKTAARINRTFNFLIYSGDSKYPRGKGALARHASQIKTRMKKMDGVLYMRLSRLKKKNKYSTSKTQE